MADGTDLSKHLPYLQARIHLYLAGQKLGRGLRRGLGADWGRTGGGLETDFGARKHAVTAPLFL